MAKPKPKTPSKSDPLLKIEEFMQDKRIAEKEIRQSIIKLIEKYSMQHAKLSLDLENDILVNMAGEVVDNLIDVELKFTYEV